MRSPSLSGSLSAITVHAFTRCLSYVRTDITVVLTLCHALQFVIIWTGAWCAWEKETRHTCRRHLCYWDLPSSIGPITGILSLSDIRRDACFPSISPSSILIMALHVQQPPSTTMTSPQTPALGNPMDSDRIFLFL